MDLSNLPEPTPAPVPVVLVPPVQVAPAAAEPAPPAAPEGSTEGLQRVADALCRLGLDVKSLGDHLLLQLENAAHAYESAKLDSDKSYWQNEGARILAALHAL